MKREVNGFSFLFGLAPLSLHINIFNLINYIIDSGVNPSNVEMIRSDANEYQV